MNTSPLPTINGHDLNKFQIANPAEKGARNVNKLVATGDPALIAYAYGMLLTTWPAALTQLEMQVGVGGKDAETFKRDVIGRFEGAQPTPPGVESQHKIGHAAYVKAVNEFNAKYGLE